MWDYIKLIALGLVAVLAAIAAGNARDLAYPDQETALDGAGEDGHALGAFAR